MQMWILFAIFVVALVVAVISVVLLLLVRNARAAQGPATLAQYPQGHWLSVGMCIGIAIGLIPSLTGIFGSLGIAVANACSLPDVGLGNASATTGGACEAERCRLSRQFPKSRMFRWSKSSFVGHSFISPGLAHWHGSCRRNLSPFGQRSVSSQ
jgi:hypothetical protein